MGGAGIVAYVWYPSTQMVATEKLGGLSCLNNVESLKPTWATGNLASKDTEGAGEGERSENRKDNRNIFKYLMIKRLILFISQA